MCGAQFRYFRGGKIYRFPVRELSTDPASGEYTAFDELYWLCGLCYPMLRLVLRCDGKVVLQRAAEADTSDMLAAPLSWGQRRAS